MARPSLMLYNTKIFIKISFYYSLIEQQKQVNWFGCSTLYILRFVSRIFFFSVVLPWLRCTARPRCLVVVVTMMIITHFPFVSFVAQSVEFWNEMNTIVIIIYYYFGFCEPAVRSAACFQRTEILHHEMYRSSLSHTFNVEIISSNEFKSIQTENNIRNEPDSVWNYFARNFTGIVFERVLFRDSMSCHCIAAIVSSSAIRFGR